MHVIEKKAHSDSSSAQYKQSLFAYLWFSYFMGALNIGSSLGIWVTSGWTSMGDVNFFVSIMVPNAFIGVVQIFFITLKSLCNGLAKGGPTLWTTSPCYVTHTQIDS